jgi:hypothetical protein
VCGEPANPGAWIPPDLPVVVQGKNEQMAMQLHLVVAIRVRDADENADPPDLCEVCRNDIVYRAMFPAKTNTATT